MKQTPDRAALAVFLLQQVLSGEIMAASALQQWPGIEPENDELMAAAWHDLSHFAQDDDIRAISEDYAEYQTRLLTRRVQELKKKFGIE